MLFYFAVRVAWVKQPVHEFLQRQSIVKIYSRMVKLATHATHAKALMKAHH